MSEVKAGSNDTNTANAGSEAEGAEGTTEETVSYKTYQEVLTQRKADQKKARDLQAQLDAATADKAATEEARLAEQKQFETLYQKEKVEREKLATQLAQMSARQVESAKVAAVKAALGGVRKDDYTKFFDLDAVQLNDDGTADAESVKQAANKFRQNYPELVATASKGRMANEAGRGIDPGPPKPLTELSNMELRQRLAAKTQKK